MHLIQLHDGIHNATVVIRATEYAERSQPRCFVYRPPVRPSECPHLSLHLSHVTWVDQSKTVGEDYAIFTVQYTSSSCGISFIQKFWRITLSGGVKQGWGWKRAIFYSSMRRYLEKNTRLK